MMFDNTSPIPGIINHSPEVDLMGSKSITIERNLFRVFLGPPSITYVFEISRDVTDAIKSAPDDDFDS